jgi:uncharacterized protein (DUF1778 family)
VAGEHEQSALEDEIHNVYHADCLTAEDQSTMPRTTASSSTPLQAVNLRVRTDTQSLIDRAASMLGRSRSDFMIEASRKAAEDAILDQRVIAVSAEAYHAFLAILDRPARANELLRQTMQTPAPWESQ